MRPVEDWTEEDLHALISSRAEESSSLEYKRSDFLHDGCQAKLSKVVSAMANSTGGLIVFGIDERDHRPVAVDDGVNDPTLNREWLENVLTSNIRPAVQGLMIKPIALHGGGEAFVVQVPQARSLGPHQAKDKLYYRRRNFKAEPMEDYEIRDIMRRQEKPHPVLEFDFDPPVLVDNGMVQTRLIVSGTNLGQEPIFYSVITIRIDAHCFEDVAITVKHPFEVTDDHVVFGSATRPMKKFAANFAIPHAMPLFFGQYGRYLDQVLRIPTATTTFLLYRIACPGFSAEHYVELRAVDGRIEVLRSSGIPLTAGGLPLVTAPIPSLDAA